MRSDTPALRTRRVLTAIVGAALLTTTAATTAPSRPSPAAGGRLVPVHSGVLARPALAHATLDNGDHRHTRPADAEERSRHPKDESGDGLDAAATPATSSTEAAAARTGVPLATAVAPSTDPATPSVTTLGQVSGIDAHLNVSYYGFTYEPGDPVVAASPSYVFEMVNTAGRITPRAGGSAINLDLGKFFDINHTSSGVDLTDPRVLWDTDTGRWFASAAVYVGATGSAVTLAVSKTSDPTGDWWLYTVTSSSTIFHDQPRLGLTSDKVVMAWDDFSPSGSSYVWDQSALGVVAKAATVAGAQPAVAVATDTRRTSNGSLVNDWYAITPAVQSVPGSRGYAVYDTSFSTVGVLTIDGVPGTNLTVTESGVGISHTSAPPQAVQPGAVEVDTGDDRFQSAVSDGSRLWLAGNDACKPSGDTTTRACLRLVELGVDTTPRLLQDIDAGLPGTDLYYPAVALDGARNLVAVYSFSSIADFPSLGVLTQPAAGGALTARTVATGTGSYTGSRWGDYAAAVADPADPNAIWVVGQTKELAGSDHFWSTAVAQVSVAAPAPAPAPAPVPAPTPAPAPVFVPASAPSGPGAGYWFVATDGGIFTFGARRFLGSTGGLALSQPTVGMASTPDGAGYWLTTRDGRVFAFGTAPALGSTGALSQPIVGMAATPSGQGYWLVAADGGIFAFGDARFLGSTGGLHLNQPIVGMAPTPSGQGYWLVARDGGIFAFGDAGFFGSTGNIRLNQPIVGMSSTSGGHGYWFVAADGGIFSFGDASFYGSTGNIRLNQPIVGMRATPSGHGYWFVASDGGIFSFGDAPFLGSTGNIRLNKPITGMT